MLDPIRQGGRSKLQRHIRKPAHRHFRFEPLESRRLLAAVLEATGVVGQAPYDQVAIHYPVGATLGDGRGTVSLNDGNLNDRLFDQSVALSEFEIGANPVSTRTADLDADGDLDLVTRSSRHLVIQKQETGGSFGSRSAHELDELIGESHCSDRIFGLGDVNGDGASELVIPCDGTFYVLERDGDGGYRNLQEPIEYPFYNGDYIKEADLNGDGYLDFVFATFQSAKHTTVLLNDGNGQLSVAPSSFSVDALVQLLELGDLDGDGKEDVVFALSNKDLSDLTDYEDQLWMQKGRGDGTFEPAEAIVSLDSRRSFVSADIVDLNRDGRADIVISDYYQYISVWYQEESGYRHQVVTMPDYVRSVRAVDVPGDSLPRLNVITQVTDDLPNSRLYTFQQTSAEVFLLRDMIDLPLSATALELGDFNNDERQDSLVSNEFSILVESDSTGGFDNAQTFPLGESLLTSDYLSRDFNEDGLDDLVFVHRNGDHLSILFGSDSKRQTQSFAIERIGLGGVFDLQSVAAFDFDGDQHLDLVARNQDSVVLLSGRGDGTFSEASVLLSDAASGFFVGDFSGDSLDDLVAVSLSAGAASFRGWWGSLSSVAARNDFQVSGDFVAYDFDAHTKKLLLLGQDGDVISVAVDPDDNTLVIEQLSSVVLVGEVWDFSAANLNGDAQPDFIIGYVVFESLLEIYRSNSEGGYQLDAIPEKVAFRELIVKDITNDGIDELTIYGSNSFRSTDSSVLYVADGAVQEERFEETRILLYADLDGDGNVDRISKSNQLNVSWGKPIEKGISAAEFSTVFRAQQNWVQVDIGGPTSELSYINVWFDFNRDGFFDANEQVVDAAEIDRSGTHRVDFSIPSNADLGRTWARIRLSQNPDLGPDGIALNGDVED